MKTLVLRVVAAPTGTLHTVCKSLKLYLSGLKRSPFDGRLLFLSAARKEEVQCRRFSFKNGKLGSQQREDMQRLMPPKQDDRLALPRKRYTQRMP